MSYIDDGRPLSTQGLLGVLFLETRQKVFRYRLALVDFGATRVYSKEFIDGWLRLLDAAATDDRDAKCLPPTSPPRDSIQAPFAFGPGSTWAGITAEIRAQISVMLRVKLTPPPRETYSSNAPWPVYVHVYIVYILALRYEGPLHGHDLLQTRREPCQKDREPILLATLISRSWVEDTSAT
ncbi:hypothetical protein C8F04DRAFT_1368094 [Mycena alexandri]|uniref:Uncharacterized protein n=1 Tax=Mycena alexandri TaxID=1745969 RepID=A0AAD6SLF9_9AGAR|nr:hypothetical protein C8F04DRAFT_1368094 [Mycena alexandri]